MIRVGAHGRRRSRRHRARKRLLTAAAAATAALAGALGFADFAGVDLASAAVERAKSFIELINRRSPGERLRGELIKTKHRHFKVLAERAAPEIPPPLLGA